MSDPKQKDQEDLTERPGSEEQIGAHEDQVVHVDGPAAGERHGTEDAGIEPEEEITPG